MEQGVACKPCAQTSTYSEVSQAEQAQVLRAGYAQIVKIVLQGEVTSIY